MSSVCTEILLEDCRVVATFYMHSENMLGLV